MLREVNKSVPIFFTKMDPCFFFDVGNVNSRKPLTALSNSIVLCVSAIGSADAFVKGMAKVLYSCPPLLYIFKHIFVCSADGQLSFKFPSWRRFQEA